MSIGIGVGITDLTVLESDVTDVVKELQRISPSWFPANAKMPNIRDNWTAAGGVYTVNGGSHLFDGDGSAQANKVWEVGENWAQATDIMPGSQLQYARHELSCFWDYTETGSTPTGAAFLGLQIGTFNSDPPFPSAPSVPLLQARINRTLPTASGVQLYSAVGDGVTAGAVVNDATGTFVTPPFEQLLRLVWEPLIPRARVYIYDILLCEQADPAKLPNFASVLPLSRAGLVVSSGSGWQVRATFTDVMFLKIR